MLSALGRFFKWFFDERNAALMLIVFVVALFLYIILPNIDTLSSIVGFPTKAELKHTVAEQQKVIDTIQDSNKALEKQAEVAQEVSTAIVEKAINIQKQQTVKAAQLSIIVSTKYKAIQKLHRDYKPPKKTVSKSHSKKTTHPHTVKKAVSHVQITAIWDTYCLYNQHKSCH